MAKNPLKHGQRYPKVVLDPLTIALVGALAAREGCSMADVVRRLVRATACRVYGTETPAQALAKARGDDAAGPLYRG